jgi:glutamine---fructose-6-phosphate transaminase (isomerizing)
MCGIAGTVYNKKIIDGFEIYPELILQVFNAFRDGTKDSSDLLDVSWKYKSNINFIRFCRDNNERILVNQIAQSIKECSEKVKTNIPKIDKSISYSLYNKAVTDYQNLLDAYWFLTVEMIRWVEAIEFLSTRNPYDLSDQAIILYKDIIKVINAIDNRLELRGRDSLGLSVSFNSSNFMDLKHKSTNIDKSIHHYKSKKFDTFNFTFKTCNSIGSLGENAADIKSMIRSNDFFNSLITSNAVDSATIMAHTRWASVGGVTIDNAHPVEYVYSDTSGNYPKISSILNGDIYNYKELISEAVQTHSFSIDTSKITNDCAAIPALLCSNNDIDVDIFGSMANKISGSCVISSQHSFEPENIYLLKKGIQGLYVGFSYDGFMFASDVYGLVETCRYFVPIETDQSFVISASNIPLIDKPFLILQNSKSQKLTRIESKNLRETNITTRDIDKKNYEHFLDKEIHDTADIVSRTVSNYVQPENITNPTDLSSSIALTENQIPEFILDRFKDKQITKIILTGMGTCYTAAVAISMHMRARLRLFMPYVIVEPHIATEGSAFYLQPNMQDTLVIVIAQSGTTVDTNVYVQKAKERGAMSLAIANKREGDVTFIVDGTLYIGDGRDIEIAVPSTKTYTAQVILGYILTLSLAARVIQNDSHKDILIKDLKNLREIDLLIESSFHELDQNIGVKNISIAGCQHNSWLIIRGTESNSVCADEIRIKYSENCYQSVASLSIEEACSISIKNSFLILIIEDDINSIYEQLMQLVNLGNSVVLIGNGIKNNINNLTSLDNVYIINMPSADEYFTFLPTILAGQILSYYQAIELDKRKLFFVDLYDSLENKIQIRETWKKLTEAIKKKKFNQGFSYADFQQLSIYINKIKNLSESNSLLIAKASDHLLEMAALSRRTIDTIKHQAKTITVGAVREGKALTSQGQSQNQYSEGNFATGILDSIIESFHDHDSFISKILSDNVGEILIAFKGTDEAFAYNITNIISDFSIQYNIDPKIRLARPYDYERASLMKKSFWIILTDSEFESTNTIFNKLNKDQITIFDYKNWDTEVLDHFGNAITSIDYKKSIWATCIALYLSAQWLIPSIGVDDIHKSLYKKIHFEIDKKLNTLIEAVNHIQESSQLIKEIDIAADAFLSRINWKCIGSGVNFNIAKYTAKRLMDLTEKSCAFDVLENHKHIDISAESSILVFIGNIWKHGYQEDAFSEIEKMIAHNNLPIIITSDNDDRFDSLVINSLNIASDSLNINVPVIKIPKLESQFSFALNVLLVHLFTAQLINWEADINQKSVALNPVSLELINEDIW